MRESGNGAGSLWLFLLALSLWENYQWHPKGKSQVCLSLASSDGADKGQDMTAERIKSWHGERRSGNKPTESWQFLEATGSHFAVKAGHRGRYFVRSNGCARGRFLLDGGRKINIARNGGWLCPGSHRASLPLGPNTANTSVLFKFCHHLGMVRAPKA